MAKSISKADQERMGCFLRNIKSKAAMDPGNHAGVKARSVARGWNRKKMKSGEYTERSGRSFLHEEEK